MPPTALQAGSLCFSTLTSGEENWEHCSSLACVEENGGRWVTRIRQNWGSSAGKLRDPKEMRPYTPASSHMRMCEPDPLKPESNQHSFQMSHQASHCSGAEFQEREASHSGEARVWNNG